MNYLELVQGSEEWRQARAGSLGASSVPDAIAKTKSGWSATRQNKMAALIIERITGKPEDSYVNAAMQHGIDTEAEARDAYSFRTDFEVRQVGLIKHPSIAWTHASPDGLIGPGGLLEIKCPQPAAHLSVLAGEAIPLKYIIQMQWQIRCSDRDWCDFVSYSPAFPEHMRLFVQRIERDNRFIGELEDSVVEFLAELDAKLAKLNERFAVREAA